MEHRARRCYAKNWGESASVQRRALYHPDELNRQLEQQLPASELDGCYGYRAGYGDAHVVSRQMYEALVATCRCGRQRRGTHVLKCLQKEQDRHLTELQNNVGPKDSATHPDLDRRVPETSNAVVGWRISGSKPRYSEWEKSTRYASPLLTMPGPRIAAVPYNVIFIG